MIVNQALGARATGELRQALTGGKLDPGKAATLKAMGFLADGPPTPEASARRGQDGQPNVTDDAQHLFPPGVQRAVALKPGALRFAPTPEDGAVPPGKILYQNAVNGAQRVADAARRMIPETLHARNDGVAAETQAMKPPPAPKSGARIGPAEIAAAPAEETPSEPGHKPVLASSPEPTPVERIRDELASGLVEAPKMALASHLFGAPHETTDRLGLSPEAAAQLRARAVAHVGHEMQARGVSPENAAQALLPGVLGPDGPVGFAARARDEILSSLASPYREVLSAHLTGETPEQIGARMGADPANVSRAADRANAHVAGIMERQGINPDDVRAVLAPRQPLASSPEPTFDEHSPKSATPAEQTRDPLATELQITNEKKSPDLASDQTNEHNDGGDLMSERGTSTGEGQKALAPRAPLSRILKAEPDQFHEIDAAPFRGTGKLGGIRLTEKMFAAIEKRLAEMTPSGEKPWFLVRGESSFPKEEAGRALFDWGKGIMYLSRNHSKPV